jgi:hypothetical protein
MAIVRDAVTDGGRTASGTSKTISHTVASGSDRYLLVAVGWEGDSDDITGVTYNGVAMQRLAVFAGETMWMYLYGLANPDTGTHDVVISADATDAIIGYVASYQGVHQTVPVDKIETKFNSGISSGAWNGASLVTRYTDTWGILLSNKTAGGTMSAGGGSNELADGDGLGLFDSNGGLGAPASESMNAFASDGTQNWAHLMLNLIPSGTTIGSTNIHVVANTRGNNGDFSHNHPAGFSNDALIVVVGTHQGVITGITYGGQAMTQLSLGSSAFDEDGSIWILLDPPTGSNTVDITRSGGSWHGAVAISLINVKQTTTVTQVSESGNESSPDINITPSTNNNLIITGIGAEAYTYTDDPQFGLSHIHGQSYEVMAASLYFQGTAAAFNSQTFLASGQRYGLAVVAIEPFSGPTQTTKTFTADGIVLVQATKTFTVDALVESETTKFLTVDGIVKETLTNTFTVDGIVRAGADKTFTADGLIARVNHVRNPSFANDSLGDNVTPGQWSFFGNDPDFKGVANDWTTFNGLFTKSFKIIGTGSNDTGIRINIGDLVVGKEYTVSVYAKSDANVDTGSFVISNEQNGSGGNQTSSNNWSGDFEGRRSITFTPNTSTFEIFLGIGAFGPTSDGTAWFGGVQLEEGATATPYFDGDRENVEWNGTPYESRSNLFATITTATFTVDAYLVYNATFTVDAIVSDATTQTATFTVDGIVKEINTAIFTADGIIFATNTQTFTVDGIIFATNTQTFTADGIIFATNTSTFTADGIVKATQTQTFTVDGIILEQFTSTFTADAIIKTLNNEATFTADGIVKVLNNEATFTADAIIQVQGNLSTFTVDGIIQARFTQTFTADGIIKVLNNENTFTADAIIKVLNNELTFTVDAIIFATNTVEFTADGIVRSGFTFEFTADGIIFATNQATFTADAIVKTLNNESTFTVDGIIQEQFTKTFTIDGIVLAVTTATFTVDALIQTQANLQTFTIDGIIFATNQATFTADGIIRAGTEASFTVDAIVLVQESETFTIDAIIQTQGNQATFTVDGIIQTQANQATFTVDGIVLQIVSTSFTADGIVSVSSTSEITLDAIVRASTLSEFTVDGIIFATNQISFTIDGRVRAGADKTFTVDGIIKIPTLISITMDGEISPVKFSSPGGKGRQGLYNEEDAPDGLYRKISPIGDPDDVPNLSTLKGLDLWEN